MATEKNFVKRYEPQPRMMTTAQNHMKYLFHLKDYPNLRGNSKTKKFYISELHYPRPILSMLEPSVKQTILGYRPLCRIYSNSKRLYEMNQWTRKVRFVKKTEEKNL